MRVGQGVLGRSEGVVATLDALAAHHELPALLLMWKIGNPWKLAQADVGNALIGKTPTDGGVACLTLACALVRCGGVPHSFVSGSSSELSPALTPLLARTFEYAKQRCTVYPRFVVQRSAFAHFLAAYLPAVRDVRFGRPWRSPTLPTRSPSSTTVH